jgi:hypothetical protein
LCGFFTTLSNRTIQNLWFICDPDTLIRYANHAKENYAKKCTSAQTDENFNPQGETIDVTVNHYDVLFGADKKHPGNKHYHEITLALLPEWKDLRSHPKKIEKQRAVVDQVIKTIQGKGGRFFTSDKCPASEMLIIEKVMQRFKDLVKPSAIRKNPRNDESSINYQEAKRGKQGQGARMKRQSISASRTSVAAATGNRKNIDESHGVSHPTQQERSAPTFKNAIDLAAMTLSGKTRHSKTCFKTCSVHDFDPKRPLLYKGEELSDDIKNTVKHVIVDGTLEIILEDSFYNCKALQVLELPIGLKVIQGNAFAKCPSLIEVVLNDGLTKIGDRAFFGCSSLTKVDIPNTVTGISDGAFHSCSSLEKITIPSSVNDCGSYCFAYCTSLKEVVLKEGLTKIGSGTFFGCSSLTKVDIPNTVTSINDAAFDSCTSLEKIIIPLSFDTLETRCYSNCTSLKEIVLKKWQTKLMFCVFNPC